VRVEHHPG